MKKVSFYFMFLIIFYGCDQKSICECSNEYLNDYGINNHNVITECNNDFENEINLFLNINGFNSIDEIDSNDIKLSWIKLFFITNCSESNKYDDSYTEYSPLDNISFDALEESYFYFISKTGDDLFELTVKNGDSVNKYSSLNVNYTRWGQDFNFGEYYISKSNYDNIEVEDKYGRNQSLKIFEKSKNPNKSFDDFIYDDIDSSFLVDGFLNNLSKQNYLQNLYKVSTDILNNKLPNRDWFLFFENYLSEKFKSKNQRLLSNIIFDSLKEVSYKLSDNNFSGTAFVGSLNGNLKMVLVNGENNEVGRNKLIHVKYNLDDWVNSKSTLVDENYIVSDLTLTSQEEERLPIRNSTGYSNTYFKGEVKCLSSTISDGIENECSNSGEVIFIVNYLNSSILILIEGENYFYQGEIELNGETFTDVKKIFNLRESEIEEKADLKLQK